MHGQVREACHMRSHLKCRHFLEALASATANVNRKKELFQRAGAGCDPNNCHSESVHYQGSYVVVWHPTLKANLHSPCNLRTVVCDPDPQTGLAAATEGLPAGAIESLMESECEGGASSALTWTTPTRWGSPLCASRMKGSFPTSLNLKHGLCFEIMQACGQENLSFPVNGTFYPACQHEQTV